MVLIHGPRQCGKTTLARRVGTKAGYAYLSFDDDVTLAAALADPIGFVAELPARYISDLGAPFQLSRPTIRDYVTLLERVFLLEELPPRHSNRLSRLIKTPKLHLGDTGVACALLGQDAASFGERLYAVPLAELWTK